ncbi:hypothetical protein PV326_001617 [Microctonus aethiopoides]|nr:hypothetical protein PV326_001617 [Microctonus aethiopoides]
MYGEATDEAGAADCRLVPHQTHRQIIIRCSKGDMEEDGKAVESAVFIETLNTRIREREKQQKKKKKKKIWVWGILHSGRGVAGGGINWRGARPPVENRFPIEHKKVVI